ncbi:unnamed protein product, partial [Musa acuminata var. zebrina]
PIEDEEGAVEEGGGDGEMGYEGRRGGGRMCAVGKGRRRGRGGERLWMRTVR